MAKAATRVSSQTTLVIGQVKVPIGLFSSSDKPGKLAEFETAGPNGGRLMRELRAADKPVDEIPAEMDAPAAKSDPLGELFRQTETEECAEPPATHMLAGATSVEGEYRNVLVEQDTGQAVLPEDVRRVVRLPGGEVVDVTEHLARIEEETRLEEARVVAFVPVTQVARSRVKASYYIGAVSPESPKALRLIYEAVKATKRVAVVKLTKRSRQTLGVIGWSGQALMLYELVWAEDMRPAPERALIIQNVEISEREREMAIELVQALSGPVSMLDELRDDAIAKREELYERAIAGQIESDVPPERGPEESGEDALFAQLEASLAAVGS